MRHADLAIIVTNPEVSSVRDSDRIIGLLDSKTVKAERGEWMEKLLLLTRYDHARAAARRHAEDRGRAGDPVDPAARHHPGSQDVLRASNVGAPVTLNNPQSAPAKAYMDAARRLRGESLDVTIPRDKKGLMGMLFGRKAA